MPTKIQVQLLITLTIKMSNLATLLNFRIELKVDIQVGGREIIHSHLQNQMPIIAMQHKMYATLQGFLSHHFLDLLHLCKGRLTLKTVLGTKFSKRDKCA